MSIQQLIKERQERRNAPKNKIIFNLRKAFNDQVNKIMSSDTVDDSVLDAFEKGHSFIILSYTETEEYYTDEILKEANLHFKVTDKTHRFYKLKFSANKCTGEKYFAFYIRKSRSWWQC